MDGNDQLTVQESKILELKRDREKLRVEVKKLGAHEREKRHKLLDKFSEIDTQIMIEQSKDGAWECEGCAKWGKTFQLDIHGTIYELCKKCYDAESEVEGE